MSHRVAIRPTRDKVGFLVAGVQQSPQWIEHWIKKIGIAELAQTVAPGDSEQCFGAQRPAQQS